jgi:hypothetical protein
MSTFGIFPFGQPVQEIVQTDRTPKRVFVLGVYASAVHARWIGADGKTVVTALAVASEPCIFWSGECAETIIKEIPVPREAGRLVPGNPQLNGPSGRALDELILGPLGLTRADAWLCDLVPHSCANPGQIKAIDNKYTPVARQYRLPLPTIKPVPEELTDEHRREAILAELQESGAGTLILLGDKPIECFLKYFDPHWTCLSDFMRNGEPYGKLHTAHLNNRQIDVLPFAHPRQIARLGLSSQDWYNRHQEWIEQCQSQGFQWKQ